MMAATSSRKLTLPIKVDRLPDKDMALTIKPTIVAQDSKG